VDVSIYQTRHDHLAFEIDGPGVLAGEGFHVIVTADGDEFAVLDSKRLCVGQNRIHRINEPVTVHHIRLNIFCFVCSRGCN